MPPEPTIGAKRRRKTIAVNDLEEADVRRISLVSRGANRIPYRIMKQENEMGLDLGSIFRRKAEHAAAGEQNQKLHIAAVVLNKAADTEGLLAAMGRDGFDMAGATIDAEALEHGLLVKFEDYEQENSFVMQFNDDVAAIMVDTEKQFSPFGGSSRFTENVRAMGFVPGLRMAQDALMETTFNILGEADDKEMAKSEIDDALKDFSSHVSSLAGSLPTAAFKLEDLRAMKQETPAAEEEAAGEGEGEGDGDSGSAEETAGAEGEAAASADNGPSGGGSGSTNIKAAPVDKTAQKAGDVVVPDGGAAATEAEGNADATLNRMFAGLLEQMEDKLKSTRDSLLADFDERLETVTKENKDLKERLTTTEEKAKATEDSVRGTVMSSSTLVDESLGVRNRDGLATTVKDDSSLDRSGLFDSAFSFPGIDDRG
jgi:hypothetical protein